MAYNMKRFVILSSPYGLSVLILGGSFDDGTYSDLTVHVPGRALRLHKAVLASHSEYFKAMLRPVVYAESTNDIVELKEDDPKAVVAVLKHLYGFQYAEIMAASTSLSPECHLNLYIAAKRYRVEDLAATVVQSLANALWEVAATLDDSQSLGKYIDFFKLLWTRAADYDDLTTPFNVFWDKSFPLLMRVSEFRAWVEETGGSLLEYQLDMLERGRELGSGIFQIFQSHCGWCHKSQVVWTPNGCPACGRNGEGVEYLAVRFAWNEISTVPAEYDVGGE